MPSTNGIIVLEGADCAGKTTLAQKICERYDGLYLHGTATDDAFKHHLELARAAINASVDRLVVVDRHWPSEQVYGPIKRAASQYNLAGRCFDRVWQKHAAIYVLCAPADSERQLAHFKHDRDAGKDEYLDDTEIKRAIAAYANLRDGMAAHPGDLYLDRLIRHGDFTWREDVVVYDMYIHDTERKLKKFMEMLVFLVESWRELQYQPALEPKRTNFTGHVSTAHHLLVGETLSAKAPGPWPFFWSDQLSAATWLNRALHDLDVDETDLLIANAFVGRQRQDFRPLVEQSDDLRVVALGAAASGVLTSQKIPHRTVVHPQYARRFRSQYHPEYVKELKEAIYG